MGPTITNSGVSRSCHLYRISPWRDLWVTRVKPAKWDRLPEKTDVEWCINLVGGFEHDFFLPYVGNNHPNWLIFFRGVETTNQKWGGNTPRQWKRCRKQKVYPDKHSQNDVELNGTTEKTILPSFGAYESLSQEFLNRDKALQKLLDVPFCG